MSASDAVWGLLVAAATLVLLAMLLRRGALGAAGQARRRLAGLGPIPAPGLAPIPAPRSLPAPIERGLRRLQRPRAVRQLERSLPGALEGMARSVRSGASVRQAVEEAGQTVAGPLGAELRSVGDELRAGAPLASTLDALATRTGLPGVRLAVAALLLGNEWGGAVARGLDGVAATLRDHLAVADEIRALGAQARMSALVISVAPVGFGAFAAATDPRTATFLFRTPLGLAFVAAGVLLDSAGWIWMRRLSGPAR